MDTKFQIWLVEHQPADNMLWKDSFWNTYIFWRDTIIPMFVTETFHWDELERHCKYIDSFAEVIGEHWSKSIANPVLKLTYKGVTFVIRYNFYDYEVAVVGDLSFNLPMKGLFSSEQSSFFYQGFPDEYQLKERYEYSKCKFMASIHNHYQFYTFMFLAKNEIDRLRGAS